MFKALLLACLLAVAGCADAKSSSSSSSSSSSRSSFKPKPTTTTKRCSGSVNPSVVYDWDDAEYEYKCPSKHKMNRFGSCVCK